MGKSLTQQEFTNKVKANFNNTITVLGEFVDTRLRIKAKCEVCGHTWEPIASSLYRGHGCRMCAAKRSGKKRRVTNDEFLTKFNNLWDGKLTPLSTYEKRHTPILVRCNICGHQWESLPHNLLHGEGCPRCCKDIHNTNDVIAFLERNHYSCSLAQGEEYTNYYTKMEFVCACGNHFTTSFASLRKTYGVCKECSALICRTKQLLSQNKAEEVVFNATGGEYELVGTYAGYSKQTTFKHVSCGHTFDARFDHLVSGATLCRVCFNNKSRGELAISKWLAANHIAFEEQKRFSDCCGDKKTLPFDFYISSLNVAIEFQGEQHYAPIKLFGGEGEFEKRVRYDAIKKNFCDANGIRLICIPYWELNNIDCFLSNVLFGAIKEVI